MGLGLLKENWKLFGWKWAADRQPADLCPLAPNQRSWPRDHARHWNYNQQVDMAQGLRDESQRKPCQESGELVRSTQKLKGIRSRPKVIIDWNPKQSPWQWMSLHQTRGGNRRSSDKTEGRTWARGLKALNLARKPSSPRPSLWVPHF